MFCSSNKMNINYLVFVPEKLEDNMPVLLFLHGIGERGNNSSDVLRYSLPNYIQEMDIPYVVICPQCEDNNFWDYHLRDVLKIIDKVCLEYHCDKSRIGIAGSSMGACGAWSYIMQRPDVFKCLISASGRVGILIDQTVKDISSKSFYICHGTDDDVIDYHNSLEIYDSLIKNGCEDVTLKLVEGGNHYVCSTAYKDPEVYKWLEKRL